jgi:formyltetrahydrofolate-dependent phosphoribosylglycinamide formyltransferase
LERFGAPATRRDGHGVIALVGSDRAAAGALEIARRQRVDTVVLDDPNDGTKMQRLLTDAGIELVVLAGYLKRVPDAVVRERRGRVLNVHPALLPAFGGRGMYGTRLHEAVLAAGVKVTGVTVHFVDEQYDHGPIIVQWPVPVFNTDSSTDLAARVLAVEHRLYPCAVAAVATGRVRLGRSGNVEGGVLAPATGHTYALVTEESQPKCQP